MKKIIFLIFIVINITTTAQKIKIYGNIFDQDKNKIPNVVIIVKETNQTKSSDPQGYYELKLNANSNYNIILNSEYHKKDTIKITTNNKKQNINFYLEKNDIAIDNIYAIATNIDETGLERISSKNLTVLPDISGNAVETLVKTSMGVSSANELSSQYNVRGGNFDENLVYINETQIYRPFLVRSGQQEGLSIINPDLVETIKFSAGGFDASYDDKMSSVLDIKYKTPKKFAASASINLLGGSVHIENISKNEKFTTINGIRYKRYKYLFNTLKIKGDYKPIFADFQTYSTYKISDKISATILGNITSNQYYFAPKTEKANIGTFAERLNINVFYQGQEKDTYQTLFGAFSLNFNPQEKLELKFITSAFLTYETEKYDILAQYYLNQAEKQQDTLKTQGDSIINLGVGAFQNHARNYLNAFVKNAAIKGQYKIQNHTLKFGTKLQIEKINDILSEWKYIDSAGYSTTPLKIINNNSITIYQTIKSENKLNNWKLNIYALDKFSLNAGFTKININIGTRITYNKYTNEILTSPRISTLITPNWIHKWYFRISSGIYYQIPFYRELRLFDGTLVENVKSQQAIHFVAGAYHTLLIWNRPFKLSSEIYYKKLNNIIPYELDNLRIKYYANQRAKGFATGIDLKLYGEFVPGTDSWISISIMKTMEDIYNDFYYEYRDINGKITNNKYLITDTIKIYPKYIPRPTDRLITASIFFQDYIPGMKNIKINLAYFFATPAPFGPPEKGRYKATRRAYKPYIRGDIGLSFLLKNPNKKYPQKHILKHFKTIWLQIEIFNFMGIENIAAYNWLSIVPNTANPNPIQYNMIASPNKLTGRIVNIKLNLYF